MKYNLNKITPKSMLNRPPNQKYPCKFTSKLLPTSIIMKYNQILYLLIFFQELLVFISRKILS